jgi:hypothetical protein
MIVALSSYSHLGNMPCTAIFSAEEWALLLRVSIHLMHCNL